MFEGKPPKAHKPQDFGVDTVRAKPLRAMTWRDLRAKLEAARDLRAELLAKDEYEQASFDAGSARRIASLSKGKHAVNLEDLANRKGTGCKGDPTPDVGTDSTRGIL